MRIMGDNSCMCEVIDAGKVATIKIKPKPDLSCPVVIKSSILCGSGNRKEVEVLNGVIWCGN